MKRKHLIDKYIYRCSNNIKRKITGSFPYVVASVACAALIAAFYAFPAWQQSAFVSDMVMLLWWLGGMTVVTLLCFYLVGDCVKPCYKPTGEELERCEVYYEKHDLEYVERVVERGEFTALERIPRSYVPNYMLITYRSPAGELMCAQLVDCTGVRQRPLTDIVVFEKEHYLFPQQLSLREYFYH